MSARRTSFTRIMAALAALATAVTLAACGGQASPGADDKKADPAPEPTGPISVVASVNQWGSLAEQIGGEDVTVTSILKTTAVDAHDFEPKTSDMTALSKADVVVVNGAGYDAWATKALSKGATLVSAADIMGAMEGDNPHLWFSKDARGAMAEELADVFAKARPKKAKAFDERLEEWKESEEELDTRMAEFAKEHKDATYAATEAVAYYLMSDLGLSDVTPEGYAAAVAAEGEVAPADLQEFQSLLESHGADVLVNNSQEASDATNMITGTAGRAEVPVVDISEQMPEEFDSLVDWISSLTDLVVKAIDPEAVSCPAPGEGDGTTPECAEAQGTDATGEGDGAQDGTEAGDNTGNEDLPPDPGK